ncbi:MAG: transcriptional repressor [Thermodesulfovibrionales bacterium]
MQRLRQEGFKLTPQRLAILRWLEGNTSHPSAEDVYRAVRKQHPTMSFATVYNTLEALHRRGRLLELTIDPDRRRYDPDTSDHHHLICVACRQVVDVKADFRIEVPGDLDGGYEITGSHVEFHGLCPRCKTQKEGDMSVFKCDKCGATKEGRCKPKKCPKCGAADTMKKKE